MRIEAHGIDTGCLFSAGIHLKLGHIMEPVKLIDLWIGIATKAVGLFGLLLGGIWAYSKFIVERGVLAPVEFTIECNVVGAQSGKRLVEVLLHLKNFGTCTLVASNLQVRVLYLNDGDGVEVVADPADRKFGRVNFLHSHARVIQNKDGNDGSSMIPVIKHPIFVQSGVDQVCTLPTAIPDSASYLLVKAQFEYRQPSEVQKKVLQLSRSLGLIQHKLERIEKPHTVERLFRVNGQFASGT